MQLKTTHFIFSVFFLVVSLDVSAQTLLTGTVRDAKTNEPLLGVSVIIDELKKGSITDSEGKYSITVPHEKYTVLFSSISHKALKKKVRCNKQKVVLNARLQPTSVQMEEVVVIAKSEAREIQEQAIPVSVITVDEIQGSVTNVSDLLTKIAGVKIRSAGGVGSASRISVRGLEGKRVAFFIDGIPLNDQSDFVSFNEIPLDIIERIEIYKGIVPAKFGSSAIGGAVNIVTVELPPKYIDISYSRLSYNTHDAKGILKRNIQDKGLIFGLGAFYTYSDNNYSFVSPYNPDLTITRDHDVYIKKVIGGSLKAKKWWFDEVAFDLIAISTKQEIQGITHNIQEAENLSNAYVLANDIKKQDFLAKGLDFNFTTVYAYTIFRFRDKAMQSYNWDGTTYEPVTDFGGEIGLDANDSYNRKHTFTQKTNFNYIINENSAVNLNTVYNFAHGIPEDTLKDKSIGYKTNFESTMHSLATGLNYEVNFFNHNLTNSATVKFYYYGINTTLVDVAGLVEKKSHDLNKYDYGFSNAIRYRFTPEFLIKASYGYDVRLPAESELLGDGFLTLPSGDLEPERNSNLNIGFMYDRTDRYNKRLQLELNVFYMKLDNMIRFVGGLLQSNYENFGEMRTIGVDVDIKYDLTSFLYLYANTTYQDLRDTREYDVGSTVKKNPTKGDRIPNRPYLFSNAGFELHEQNLFGGSRQESKFFFENSFVEEYFYDFEQTKREKRRIPRSSVFNMGLEHSFRDKNVVIGFQVNNLFDEDVITIFNRPMPGRTMGMKFRYIIK